MLGVVELAELERFLLAYVDPREKIVRLRGRGDAAKARATIHAAIVTRSQG